MLKNNKPVNVLNLRKDDDITIFHNNLKDSPCGYDGRPMKFISILGNYIYVSVDTLKTGKYDYISHYCLDDLKVARFPKAVLQQIQLKK